MDEKIKRGHEGGSQSSIELYLMRLGGLVIITSALFTYITLAPFNSEQILMDGQVRTSFSAVFRLISFPTYSASVLALRYAVSLLYLITGGIFFLFGWRKENQYPASAIHAGLLLFLLPAALLVNCPAWGCHLIAPGTKY